jgi:uncharacterized protein YbcC (UPF0753/DUF2309 family)
MTTASTSPSMRTHTEETTPDQAWTAAVDAAVSAACERIAPTWPLDRFIAVNPFWPRTHLPVGDVASELASLSGARLLMPRSWYREAWGSGVFSDQEVRAALDELGVNANVAEVDKHLRREPSATTIFPRVMDLVDARATSTHPMRWRDFVVHHTSQFCASYFDEGQASLRPAKGAGLFPTWRELAGADHGPSALMGLSIFRSQARRLPSTPEETIRAGLRVLGVDPDNLESYLSALLLDLNGWASWCSYQRWQARLAGADDSSLVHLLAIRVAWEWILYDANKPAMGGAWQLALGRATGAASPIRGSQALDWVAQRAVELAWETELARGLGRGLATPRPVAPSVQAVFCIDVRSEVFRRAFEAQSSAVETLGFAGFFGLPIAYQPFANSAARPQLPGLLAPRLRVVEGGASPDQVEHGRTVLQRKSDWKDFIVHAPSTFAFVEAAGVACALDLLAATFRLRPEHAVDAAGIPADVRGRLKPSLATTVSGDPIRTEDRVALAEGMLKGMSLTRGFARLVLLTGHGSSSVNNPHAAGLDCGACGGQSGKVNARVAAMLLNHPEVRSGLATRGIVVPTTTWFLPALHDTTTDEVALFDLEDAPASHAADIAEVGRWIADAGAKARQERAPSLGVKAGSAAELKAAFQARARDWGLVRPEWGLANNASFVVAPREHSRHLNLGGRVFMHAYRPDEDADGSVLEQIMTAPMVVAHWINFQYYASTVDNLRYGSGNKVLHNVVGGHLGVFEGNGGDLRIGLPMQSLHDGQRWRHTPLRLSVYIEAPRARIEAVIRKHAKVRDLVEKGWVHLYQMDVDERTVYRYRAGTWINVEDASHE